ncbi:MAG: hypothetical protein ACR2NB_13195 [Solirubrobacteraceae bacterium]
MTTTTTATRVPRARRPCAAGTPTAPSGGRNGLEDRQRCLRLVARVDRRPRPTVTHATAGTAGAVAAYRERRRKQLTRTKAGAALFELRLERLRVHGVECVDGRPKVRD